MLCDGWNKRPGSVTWEWRDHQNPGKVKPRVPSEMGNEIFGADVAVSKGSP